MKISDYSMEEIYQFIKEGFPEGFDQWNKRTKWGMPVACAAAASGTLPEGFTKWHLADSCGRTVAHVQAAAGVLPPDFSQWALADNDGWTVAHQAAKNARLGLPADFDRWSMADQNGTTVAHVAAVFGTLPKNFSDWDMADKYGRTVMDEAVTAGTVPDAVVERILRMAESGPMPDGFRHWSLRNEEGVGVAHMQAAAGTLPADFDQWGMLDGSGLTVAHTAATYDTLPSGFNQWELGARTGQSVAHEAAMCGTLPEDFNQWNIRNFMGETVREVAIKFGTYPDDPAMPEHRITLVRVNAHQNPHRNTASDGALIYNGELIAAEMAHYPEESWALIERAGERLAKAMGVPCERLDVRCDTPHWKWEDIIAENDLGVTENKPKSAPKMGM